MYIFYLIFLKARGKSLSLLFCFLIRKKFTRKNYNNLLNAITKTL